MIPQKDDLIPYKEAVGLKFVTGDIIFRSSTKMIVIGGKGGWKTS